jgi:hypothetical protein
MTLIDEAFKNERRDKKDVWENELKSLGIEPRRPNDLNDKQSFRHWQKSSKKSIIKIIKPAYSDVNNHNKKNNNINN